ncbi:ankyrin repeat domain-containing protein 26-like [Grammomys surdaster]|uniref:ankyrin repeat domain-containing protein 26-like n=1 Tax=Grammomys surdaster TaxID=491861 RepID=UPI0010A015BC|nr:ankyrin repeat domain-containing protein 26-like [Grammomys surdaster]
MKKILAHGVKEKTPMGFCDVPQKNLLDFLRDMKNISVSNEPRYKPLRKIHQAASEGDTERLQRMIRLGKHSVHDRDIKQRTALHFACAYGQVEVVSVLLRNNCDIDAVDRNSITPLMKAVQNWKYECVCILLKHGADPNHMDNNGNTSLHYAVSEDNQTLAKCLLKSSANMEQKNKDGFTPLLLALKENKIEMAKFLVKKGANIHVFDKMKRNTLLYAIRWDSKDMVNLLLDEGIDFFFKDVFGWTALRYAIEGTSKGSREILMNYDEKLRRKHKDGIPEYRNFEDNSLDKHSSDPTSGSTLPKSSENACDFDDEPDIPKYVLTTCPSNICEAGHQGDKSETKGIVDVQVRMNPTLKSSSKRKEPILNEVGTMTESHHFIIESDLKIESLEETFSCDNEDKQSVSDDGHFSGTTSEWCQNDTNRQTTAQDCMYPNLKSSTEGKIYILSEAGKTAESLHFIIESDLEIESLEETLSCDNKDKQLLV